MEVPAAAVARYQRSELWISHLTLILGAIAALLAGFLYNSRWGIGLMIGASLAWLNFRWLRQGVDALTETVAAQRDRRKRKIPLLTYFKAAFRYALIALVVYVIFKHLNVPALSMILGLCALGAATLAVSVHEMLRPQE
jgi:small-conductance mechanosensitive channel